MRPLFWNPGYATGDMSPQNANMNQRKSMPGNDRTSNHIWSRGLNPEKERKGTPGEGRNENPEVHAWNITEGHVKKLTRQTTLGVACIS